MLKLEFIKCQGSGNDFILFDGLNPAFVSTPVSYNQLARLLCQRECSVGADGLLLLTRDREDEFVMRMFNPDGSEARMCGNGIRCIARQVMQHTNAPRFTVRSGGLRYRITREEPIFESIPTYGVEIPVSLATGKLPLRIQAAELIDTVLPELDANLRFTALFPGNPHLVAFVPEIDPAKLSSLGEKIPHLPHLLPEGANISLCRKQAPQAIFVSTFERGAGLTLSCGTAMTAASTAACLLHRCAYDLPIRVYNKGGMVHCVCSRSGGHPVTRLIGNASFEYKGECLFVPETGQVSWQVLERYPEETEAYTRFVQSLA